MVFDENEILEEVEKSLERALKKEKLKVRLQSKGSSGQSKIGSDGVSLMDNQKGPATDIYDGPVKGDDGTSLSKPDYYGPVESPAADDTAKPSPAFDIGSKQSENQQESSDEPSESSKPDKSKPSTNIGPGPQAQPMDAGGGVGSEQSVADESPQEPLKQESETEPERKRELDSPKMQELDESQKENTQQTGSELASQDKEKRKTEPEVEALSQSSSDSESKSSRVLKKEQTKEKRRLKKQGRDKAKAVFEKAIKKAGSKMGLRAANYGGGATLIGLFIPLIIMNAQLFFTLFPIVLKILPIPKGLAEILKFNFKDAFDMFDMLTIILIDILIFTSIILIIAILAIELKIIMSPFEAAWMVITG